MEPFDKESIIRRYSKRLKEFGYDPKTLGWGKQRHKLRYYILLSQWELTNKSILDFGCGFGDMFSYCKEMGVNVIYEGIDINPELIAEGEKIYPQANLKVRDIFEEGLDKKYDYIFSSGVHNLKLKNNDEFVEKTFQLFDKYSLEGFAVNFVSNHVDYKDEHLFYADPSKILNLALSYTNRVILRHDYMPFEFTVFIDKRDRADKYYNVFLDFMKYI